MFCDQVIGCDINLSLRAQVVLHEYRVLRTDEITRPTKSSNSLLLQNRCMVIINYYSGFERVMYHGMLHIGVSKY